MKTKFFLLIIAFMASLIINEYGFSEDDIYYARCNLKVIKGNRITWVNWQSTKTIVPLGAELRVSKGGRKATLVDTNTEKSYVLDIGNEGDIFLEKFVTKKKVDIDKFPENVQRNIEKTIAKIGMTKEEV